MPNRDYEPQTIEAKWQEYWEKNNTFAVDLKDESKEKFFMLTMYPYPSGALHTGHVMEYTIGDLIARFKRMQGYNVLFPAGWDSFGLPAENAAIKNNIPPAKFTYDNIDNMTSQMKRAGWSNCWDSEIATSHPGYYKWNQWIFNRMYEKGLAYKKNAAVNWCPECMTVLANEQVIDGKCERHGCEVTMKQLNQWFIKITDYAQRLLDEFGANWDPKVISMQQKWIGCSEGARIDFKIEKTGEILPVFTTRPDTIYGVTFMSMAPEHPLIADLVKGTEKEKEVMDFVNRVTKEPTFLRSAENAVKEGVFTGHYVINPVNGEKAQLWVANYALMEYGTGAVMAVPAHDQRDFEFAKKYDIPIKIVIKPEDGELDPATMEAAYVEDGIQVNSGPFNGLNNRKAIPQIINYFKEQNMGGSTINYRLRDWLVSRQRYWGTPIPIIYCDKCGTVPVPDDQLPVMLPDNVDFKPTGKSPLDTVPEFVNTTCPTCGGPAKRETDTMDTFVDSSWYFFRYLTPRDENQPMDKELIKKWFPIDLYIGGIEHANGHLVFSRFFTKFLKDIEAQPYAEYADKMFTHGMVCMMAYHCKKCQWVHRDDVENEKTCKKCGGKVTPEMTKMSKSKLNTISPDQIFNEYGADSLRLYILFMGPPDKSSTYSEQGLMGAHRFIKRLYDFVQTHADELKGIEYYNGDGSDLNKDNRLLRTKLHQTIKKVTKDNDNFAYNTAVAACMEFMNSVKSTKDINPNLLKQSIESLVLMLYTMTPHISEEMWEILGHEPSAQFAPWPRFDEELAKDEEIEIVFQVNGKIKNKIQVAAGTDEEAMKQLALDDEKVKKTTEGKTIRKVIVVKGRLVNIVAN